MKFFLKKQNKGKQLQEEDISSDGWRSSFNEISDQWLTLEPIQFLAIPWLKQRCLPSHEISSVGGGNHVPLPPGRFFADHSIFPRKNNAEEKKTTRTFFYWKRNWKGNMILFYNASYCKILSLRNFFFMRCFPLFFPTETIIFFLCPRQELIVF